MLSGMVTSSTGSGLSDSSGPDWRRMSAMLMRLSLSAKRPCSRAVPGRPQARSTTDRRLLHDRLMWMTRSIAALLLAVASNLALAQTAPIWSVPEVGALPRDDQGMQIRAGRDLVTAT